MKTAYRKNSRVIVLTDEQLQGLGIVSPVPLGQWNSAIKYQKLNIVRYNGASYIARTPNINVEPIVSPIWQNVWMPLSYDGGSVSPDGIYPNMTVGKVSNSLTWGEKSYDGSVPQTITAEDLGVASAYIPHGTIPFSSLPANPSQDNVGFVWNISDDFTTDSRFIEGAGNNYSAGTNVSVIENGTSYYYDVLGNFVDLSNYAEINGTYPDMTVGTAQSLEGEYELLPDGTYNLIINIKTS